MAYLPQAASSHYLDQQRLALATVAATRVAWAAMGSEFDASWEDVGPNVTTLVTAAQFASARQGSAYIADVLKETGQPDNPVGTVNTRLFVGISASGESLAGLLYGAVIRAKRASRGGNTPPAQALLAGRNWLDMTVQTAVADAARGAAGVAVIARPKLGYTRMLNPPSCSRCTILAGRWYHANAGFLRHPRCDCRHIPAVEAMAGDFATDPTEYFQSIPAAEQDRIFTKAGAQAIRDGADMARVVNARSGMTTAGTPKTRINAQGLVVNERRRSLVRDRTGQFRVGSRLMPEQIYEIAPSRNDAVRLLRANGFIRD